MEVKDLRKAAMMADTCELIVTSVGEGSQLNRKTIEDSSPMSPVSISRGFPNWPQTESKRSE